MNREQMRLVEGLTNHESLASDILTYIKENFNVNGEYLNEEHVIKLFVENNAVAIARAKDFIDNQFGADLFQVVF